MDVQQVPVPEVPAAEENIQHVVQVLGPFPSAVYTRAAVILQMVRQLRRDGAKKMVSKIRRHSKWIVGLSALTLAAREHHQGLTLMEMADAASLPSKRELTHCYLALAEIFRSSVKSPTVTELAVRAAGRLQLDAAVVEQITRISKRLTKMVDTTNNLKIQTATLAGLAVLLGQGGYAAEMSTKAITLSSNHRGKTEGWKQMKQNLKAISSVLYVDVRTLRKALIQLLPQRWALLAGVSNNPNTTT